MQKLGIIAGNGVLPKCLIDDCLKKRRSFCVVAIQGQAEPDLLKANVPGIWARMGSVGKILAYFKKKGVQDLVLIGGVRRPSVAEIWPDVKGLFLLSKIGLNKWGDDGVLRAVVGLLNKEGFCVQGIDTIIPELLAPEGILGVVNPSDKDWADIQRGLTVAKKLGEADVGQSVLVQRGIVLSVEGVEGTAALIHRSGDLKRKGGGGVLVKTAKPQQDKRVDLPTVGPATIEALFKAGFKGLAVEAGSVLLAESEKMIRLANKRGLFIAGVRDGK